jgi:hypothetical protein
MEDPLNAFAGCTHDPHICDISLHNLTGRLASVLLEVSAAAHHEAIEHTNAPSACNQTVNQMTADEAGATRYQIQRFTPQCPKFFFTQYGSAPNTVNLDASTAKM